MAEQSWRIELLGELRAILGKRVLTRFYTHKIGGLLAYLALHPDRPAPREELSALFWPEADAEQGRISLRTALASLRRQLEPPDLELGSVLLADRLSVHLRPEAITTDVAEFDRLLKESRLGDMQAQIERLSRAVSLYRGDLLSGYYDGWITLERARLSEARFEALRRLADALETRGDYEQAIVFSRRVVHANALDESAHASLIRLYIALRRPSAAWRQYQEWERILREELNATPSPSVQALLQSLKHGAAGEEAVLGISQVTPLSPVPGPEELPGDSEAVVRFAPPAGALPSPFTPFFGRSEEIAQVQALLEQPDTRVVTLTGLGGSGKTRLALEVARRLQENGERLVCFVSLVDVTEANLIGETICSAFQIESYDENDPLDLVAKRLQEQPALLVLDNFEQLIAVGIEPVRRLLETCPRLTCLITSRVRLGMTGEWELPVLPLPTPAAPGTPQHLMEFAAVQLFVSRAQAARPDFRITASNAQAVSQLCHALEGLPLALELAAARIPVLTPAQMLRQVANRFGFLVARHRDAAERHRTLGAALEWSYQALDASRQQLLVSLSVFRGGWTLEAAESVCAEPNALDYLMDLRDASLLMAEEREGEMRFRMLETVREYAAERLAERGAEEEVRRRYLAYYLRLAEEHTWACSGSVFIAWRARIEADYENIRTAVIGSLRKEALGTTVGVETALRLTGSLGAYWILSHHFREGLHWLRQAIEGARALAAPVSDAVWALALMSAGYVAFVANEFAAARQDTEAGLTFARKAGDRIQQIQCLAILAQLPADPADPDHSLRYLKEAQDIAVETGNPRKIAFVLYVLGRISYLRGEEAHALTALEESLALSRSTNDGNMQAHAAANLAALALCRGDVDLARALSLEARETYNARGFRDTRGFNGIVANVQAFIALLEGHTAQARTLFMRRLETSREGDISPNILLGLGVVTSIEGDAETAAELLGAATRRYQELGFSPEPLEKCFRDRALAHIREHLAVERFQAAWARGQQGAPTPFFAKNSRFRAGFTQI